MKTIREKNILRKYFLMVAVIILLFAGGYRAFTIYKTYQNYKQEISSIERNADNNVHSVLKVVIEEAYDTMSYKTKIDSNTLHRMMIESMPINDIYNNIVNMNLDTKFINILNEVFDLSESEDKVIITVGTKDYVIYCKSNIDSDVYDHFDTTKKYITWEEYYGFMFDPKDKQPYRNCETL